MRRKCAARKRAAKILLMRPGPPLYCCGMRPRVHSIETGHRHDVDVVVHGTALIELLKIAEMLLIAVAIPVCNYSI